MHANARRMDRFRRRIKEAVSKGGKVSLRTELSEEAGQRRLRSHGRIIDEDRIGPPVARSQRQGRSGLPGAGA